MTLDLNLPPTADEEDDLFHGLPHGHDHPPPSAAQPMGDGDGDGDGAPSFDLNMTAYDSG